MYVYKHTYICNMYADMNIIFQRQLFSNWKMLGTRINCLLLVTVNLTGISAVCYKH